MSINIKLFTAGTVTHSSGERSQVIDLNALRDFTSAVPLGNYLILQLIVFLSQVFILREISEQ